MRIHLSVLGGPLAWLVVLLYFAALACCYYDPSETDRQPKAALVTVAQQTDLPQMLSSMQQVEERFNYRYNYHWVFFSTEDLGDRFKELTSNATNATCRYEIIRDENWIIPGCHDHVRSCTLPERDLGVDPEILARMVNLRQLNRWNSAPFAREPGMQYYDWFWRVEPGVCNIVPFLLT